MGAIVLWTLRQRRYQAFAALMLVLALGCIGAGTWQVFRLQQKVHDNNLLVRNAHAAPVPLGSLVPMVGAGATPGREAIRYRAVTFTGSYLDQPAQFLRNQAQDGVNGYYVLGAVRASTGTLLVVRGFAAAAPGTGAPPAVASPPAGPVAITGRLQTPDTKADAAARLPAGQLESVNPSDQAARLAGPVYDAYLTLDAGQPGADGLDALPAPDLSNPAGGAVEPQHVAYVVQWYLFALLALLAPFAVARHELRDAQARFLGVDPDGGELAASDQRPALTSGGGELAVRESGTLARWPGVTPERWRRAARLADRYDRSLSTDTTPPPPTAAGVVRPSGAAARGPYRLPNSAVEPHRAQGGDAYQGAYNDYLWQLALADGRVPAVDVPVDAESAARGLPAAEPPGDDGPTVIEGNPH